ncbi:MAG TPA: cell division protein, partial [Sphingomicrobium sp.]|nr:cell division protein [Sphingomicrobium sp.]
MMLGWLFASPADRRLLGSGRFRGPTPWVIAIMSFSIMIIAATGLAIANTASSLSDAIQARYALEVPSGGQNLDALVATLKSAQGVVSIQPVTESDMRRTLQRWLGPAAQSADLPVPALVNFDVRPGTDVKAIEKRLRSIAPTAQVSAHSERVAPLLRSMLALQWLAFGLVLLLSAAAAAAVVLAARGALDTHRFTIEVMHGIGASDLQLTHLFQRKIALDALVGSIIGALAGALVIAALANG